MATTAASSVILIILNVLHVIFALALTSAAIWFFIEVYGITSLRNENHYLLDYNVYWPQAIPWVFIIVAVFVICVSCCGFLGAVNKANGLVKMYIAFEVFVIIGLVVAAIVALTLADSKASEKFVTDAIWDAYIQSKTNKDVEMAFSTIEKRYQCCGAAAPRDYKNWRREFPISCCDTYYHGWIGGYAIDCDFSNKLANERHGCIEVAVQYTSIVIEIFSGVALFTALIGVLNVIVAFTMLTSMKRKPRLPVQQEFESKKVLL